MSTVQSTILDAISSNGRGKVFTAKDLLHFGSREAVDQALSRLARSGEIERLGRGLYHYSRTNARLGIRLAPDTEEIAQALARQTGSRIAPSGAVAANRLGLSTQVPAKPVYLTDGRSRDVKVGNTVFVMKHVPPKELPLGNPLSALVFQALRHLGKDAVDEEVISRLRRAIPARDRRKLLEDARYTTDWVAEIVRKVTAEEPEEVGVHG
jgi:Family of unknown function (DUF6088)